MSPEQLCKLRQLVADKAALERQKAGTMAQMIRECVRALTQTTDEVQRRLERTQKRVHMHEPGKVVAKQKAEALLYLQVLATMLEDESVRSPDTNTIEG